MNTNCNPINETTPSLNYDSNDMLQLTNAYKALHSYIEDSIAAKTLNPMDGHRRLIR